eukprot:Sspe_Gene.96067::Locus_68460_Transcript_2_2_Confidence_0.500_Length_664::g.96067::m.96067/K11405/HDAC8; histone deacetylase 8
MPRNLRSGALGWKESGSVSKVVYSPDCVRAARIPRHPQRGPLVHLLLASCGLLHDVLEPSPASRSDLLMFHSTDFVDAMVVDDDTVEADADSFDELVVTPPRKRPRTEAASLEDLVGVHGMDDDDADHVALLSPRPALGLDGDCPRFKGLWRYATSVAGGTMTAARALLSKWCLRSVFWEGGRHHCHRDSASGFCYVSDVVLGVQ